MGKKKKRGRIKQTRTDFQKVFDRHPGMIQDFSWHDRLPELIHISAALSEYDYQTVKTDFYIISDYVNSKHKSNRQFHFNLSHTIRLIKEDKTVLECIFKTCFRSAFEQILAFYSDMLGIEIDFEFTPNPKILFHGYKQILNGRSNVAILCKYLMMQYEQQGKDDPFNLFGLTTADDILQLDSISSTMANFPPSVGLSENFDLEFCQEIWMYNYSFSPLMPRPDITDQESERFKEMNLGELTERVNALYSEFREINLLAVYSTTLAEIQMGFVSRICDLSLDVVDLVKTHKGEIAELTIRTVLETYIVGSWLIKRKDPELYKRFREYSTGRDKFFGDKLADKVGEGLIKEQAKKIVVDAIKEAGVNAISVATERGDIFELNISQMADEVWGAENMYYFIYKRSSEVTHGHWRVMAQYHLAKSANPMHNGLYWYNENSNRFSSLTPAFFGLLMSTDFIIEILNDIKAEQVSKLKENLIVLNKEIYATYMNFFKKYMLETDDGTIEKNKQ
jgi:hypothetical protein